MKTLTFSHSVIYNVQRASHVPSSRCCCWCVLRLETIFEINVMLMYSIIQNLDVSFKI